MKPEREEVLDLVRRGKLSQAKAARQLNVSRQYVGKLVKKGKPMLSNSPAPAPAPSPAKPPALPPVPPSAPAAPTAGQAPATGAARPRSLQDMIREMNGGGTPTTPGALPPPPGPAPEFDPRDVAAGKEIFELLDGGVNTYIGTRVFGLDGDAPELQELKKPNKFLSLALERNESKMAWVGKWTNGLPGLGIGAVAEVIRAFIHFGGKGLKPVESPLAPPPTATPGAAASDVSEEEDDSQEGGFSISKLKAHAAGGK